MRDRSLLQVDILGSVSASALRVDRYPERAVDHRDYTARSPRSPVSMRRASSTELT